ncbi:sugar phosphate isomerase/epimerase [Coraliomargarita sp. SDUM461004]|uniref:Sugar phosphate isomerase/epimerase n=1 Tax=Thalassobacterium sedimentorum TaxID=3041258 RepID=A0ABU1AIQ1_9BACT|nr:sugar phosphate isomerase/epimerase [Coraliomargarita sp. SDUM461004]MDQ8193750.1 sugar phosphate isomerase/epimerase [Coraliomargarita sp. SDUM461004]
MTILPQITVQLYSVREHASNDYEATLRSIAAMGFGCVEPAGYPSYTAEKAAKLFSELGLSAPTAHIALPVGDKKNEIIEQALMMGHKYLITGCPPNFKENFSSIDTIKATAELYCQAAENAAAHGLQVGYHNHDWDLIDVDGKPGYQVFLDNTPETILWEADLFWVARAGRSPVEFLKEIGVRGKALHFKDGNTHTNDTFTEAETEDGKIMVSDAIPFLPAGTGQVDLIAASKVATYAEYIAVELDSYNGDMMEAIQTSYTYLTSQGIAQGKR